MFFDTVFQNYRFFVKTGFDDDYEQPGEEPSTMIQVQNLHTCDVYQAKHKGIAGLDQHDCVVMIPADVLGDTMCALLMGFDVLGKCSIVREKNRLLLTMDWTPTHYPDQRLTAFIPIDFVCNASKFVTLETTVKNMCSGEV